MGIETALLAAGTAVSVAGAVQQRNALRQAGRQAEETARYNQSIRERNARVAENNADYRRRVGERDIKRFRSEIGKIQAQAGVAFRKRGVVASTGTPLEVLLENANQAAEQEQLMRLQAFTEAGQMREQAAGQRAAGQLTLLEGQQRRAAFNTQARGAIFDALQKGLMGGYRISQTLSPLDKLIT